MKLANKLKLATMKLDPQQNEIRQQQLQLAKWNQIYLYLSDLKLLIFWLSITLEYGNVLNKNTIAQ